jgi:hypothetical protein
VTCVSVATLPCAMPLSQQARSVGITVGLWGCMVGAVTARRGVDSMPICGAAVHCAVSRIDAASYLSEANSEVPERATLAASA